MNNDSNHDNFDFLNDADLDVDEVSQRQIPIQTEFLTLKLLKEAIRAQNPNDAVMQDFAEIVLPKLLRYAIGVTAKGGKFFDVIDAKRAAVGKEPVRRDNAADQSLNTHILNGLFPANLIERRLQRLNTSVSRYVHAQERRLAMAGFLLHDFEKFKYDLIPDMPEAYRAIARDIDPDIRKLSVEQHREIITMLVKALSIDRFINPEAPHQWQDYLDDLLFIAYNAQRKHDTNLNLSTDGLSPMLRDRTLGYLADLTCLADRLASIVKHPQDAESSSLYEIIHKLSDGQLKFTYHSMAENRGVLTNVVNNALIAAHTSLNTDEHHCYEPLLYLSTGVIYLADRDAPPIDTSQVPDRVVTSMKQLCAGQLSARQTGFGRDGKGMKYAEYYSLFFEPDGLMRVALDATLRVLHPTKKSVAKSRSDNLVRFQSLGVLSTDYNFEFEDDIRIDQFAEFGDVISRKIWGEFVHKVEQARKARAKENKKIKKKEQKLPEIPPIELAPTELVYKVAEYLGLEQYAPPIREIQKINESLKAHKLKGNTGGVPYEWYFLAARYVTGSGIEDVRESCDRIVAFVTTLIKPILGKYDLSDGWDDLRAWVMQVVMVPGQVSATAQVDIFLQELASYNAAKKPGRGRQLICAVSHSAYSVSEQMESAVLFTPQVYTNKQHLGGSNAKRNISSIAGLEMMLRQILMNQTQAVGKRFEDGKYRYLYFYPTYYFTPETNQFLQKAYSGVAQTRFDTKLRNHFIYDFQANFSRERYQSSDAFLIDGDLERKTTLPEDHPDYIKDRTFKLSYPADQPLTFYFMALPPGRDSTDTESWVLPSWLAFAFPMILDVKTVVSESPIPPFNDGAEFEESVFLDSAPHAFRALVGRDRFRLDYILEGWQDGKQSYASPLNILTAAYTIHLDVHAGQGRGGYDANWGRLTELAKDVETTPLYVFSYLAKWSRSQKSDAPSPKKIRLYAHYFYPCFDPYATYNFQAEEWELQPESPLNHPKQLTNLYRVFYRANKRYNPKANAVLKPIDIAAETILKAESSVFFGETLVAAVAAEVFKLMDRVHASTAEGRWIISKREEERQAVLAFAQYFVIDVFEKTFAGDRARLAGKQLNLLKDTCEFLYRLADDEENQTRAAAETARA
ncbi:MAG: type I-D CRISPR-associated protein Cas10d/Csc3 [Cyanothece sp. SIO1E1]|nr:type I-D CRISPR-associated protein Cas10d/Csc3 [Cyanothece sp. SIO1E1]